MKKKKIQIKFKVSLILSIVFVALVTGVALRFTYVKGVSKGMKIGTVRGAQFMFSKIQQELKKNGIELQMEAQEKQ